MQAFNYKEIAESQLNVSIDLYLSERCYISALTLAGAAEEILGKFLKESDQKSALDIKRISILDSVKFINETFYPESEINEAEIKIDLNVAKNAVKHPQKSPPQFCAKQEAAKMIKRAIKNYRKSYGLKVPKYIKDFEKAYYDTTSPQRKSLG